MAIQHALEQQEILYQLGVWGFMSKDEIEALYAAKTDYEVDRLARKYRDKYWDDIPDSDMEIEDIDIDEREDVEIINTTLSKVTKNTLMRCHITTISQFIDFVNQNGWAKIKRFGEKKAFEIFRYIYPNESDEAILKYVNDYREKY